MEWAVARQYYREDPGAIHSDSSNSIPGPSFLSHARRIVSPIEIIGNAFSRVASSTEKTAAVAKPVAPAAAESEES